MTSSCGPTCILNENLFIISNFFFKNMNQRSELQRLHAQIEDGKQELAELDKKLQESKEELQQLSVSRVNMFLSLIGEFFNEHPPTTTMILIRNPKMPKEVAEIIAGNGFSVTKKFIGTNLYIIKICPVPEDSAPCVKGFMN
jgi:seryl-tRNA synthetase